MGEGLRDMRDSGMGKSSVPEAPEFGGAPEARKAFDLLMDRAKFDEVFERLRDGSATEEELAAACTVEAVRAVVTVEGDVTGSGRHLEDFSGEEKERVSAMRDSMTVNADEASEMGQLARQLRDTRLASV